MPPLEITPPPTKDTTMSQENQQQNAAAEPDVEPLSDDALDSVAGGSGEYCSLTGCSGGGLQANP